MTRNIAGSGVAPHVLLVDDDGDGLRRTQAALEPFEFSIACSPCGEPAIARLESDVYDAVVLCTCKPGIEGLLVLSRARALQVTAEFLVLTDDEHMETAVEAMRLGAFDYLRKPINTEQ